MGTKEYIDLISNQKPDIRQLIELLSDKVLTEDSLKQIVINQLISNDHILVYYHSFLILDKALRKAPSLFYTYWDEFESLFEHKNSYHRNYAMRLLAGLTKIDDQKKFDRIIDKYYNQLNDEKFLTRRYCILNSLEIIRNRLELSDIIICKIVSFLKTSDCTEKQQNLIISDLIQIVSEIPLLLTNIKELSQFLLMISNQSNSAKLKKQIMRIMPSTYILQRES
jgi:hypothetical protein